MADHVAVTPNRWIPRPNVRKYIYKVLVATGPLLALYGLVSDAEFIVWLGIAETVLGSPVAALALVNTPTKEVAVPAAPVVRDDLTGI